MIIIYTRTRLFNVSSTRRTSKPTPRSRRGSFPERPEAAPSSHPYTSSRGPLVPDTCLDVLLTKKIERPPRIARAVGQHPAYDDASFEHLLDELLERTTVADVVVRGDDCQHLKCLHIDRHVSLDEASALVPVIPHPLALHCLEPSAVDDRFTRRRRKRRAHLPRLTCSRSNGRFFSHVRASNCFPHFM